MRAVISGGGGAAGKCTIEVNVDQVAVVEISGDQGRLITEQGQPASKSDQLLFQVTWLQAEAEGWDVQANSLGAADSRPLVFPSHNP